MSPRPALPLAESLAAAQAWWREAGVDYGYRDEPLGWLANEEPAGQSTPAATAPKPEPERHPIGGDRGGWPQDLAAFGRWWLEEPSLDEGSLYPRVAPRGEAGAALMMLVTMPEAEDRETLLSGAHGRLLASFARAAGLAPGTVAIAAALPRHMPLPDWNALAARGHGDILLHLLALARPQRLIVFGRGILPLLGHSPAQGAPAVSELSIQGRPLPLLWTYAPENLLKSDRERATLWRRWLEWTDGSSK
jgi:DNA polymerase